MCYACGPNNPLNLACLPLASGAGLYAMFTGWPTVRVRLLFFHTSFLALFCAALASVYPFHQAYLRHLRMDRSLLVAVSSQVIACLAALVVLDQVVVAWGYSGYAAELVFAIGRVLGAW